MDRPVLLNGQNKDIKRTEACKYPLWLLMACSRWNSLLTFKKWNSAALLFIYSLAFQKK